MQITAAEQAGIENRADYYDRTGALRDMLQNHLTQLFTLIAIRLRHPPQQLFRETPLENMASNWILLSLQPSEGMHMEIHAKQPGLGMSTRLIRTDAGYRSSDEVASDAYQALLLDVFRGDATLFIRFDEVEWAWRIVDPVLKFWAQEREFIHSYPVGSRAPDESSRLFDAEDQVWRNAVDGSAFNATEETARTIRGTGLHRMMP